MLNKMQRLTSMAAGNLVSHRHNEKASVLFLRAVMLYVLASVLHVWSMSSVLFHSEDIVISENILTRLFFLPAIGATLNIHGFFLLTVVFVLVAIALRPSYVINVLLFWLVANLVWLKMPVYNGSDFVLVMMTLYAIPIGGQGLAHPIPTGAFNLSRLLLQWQVILIYLVSGLDKLWSPEWRTGEVFDYIRHFEVMFNPHFNDILSITAVQYAVAWSTIAFELVFGVFVNIKRTRLLILCVGVVFHVFIWLVLSLPDFALVMIISYLTFITDDDLKRLRLLRR